LPAVDPPEAQPLRVGAAPALPGEDVDVRRVGDGASPRLVRGAEDRPPRHLPPRDQEPVRDLRGDGAVRGRHARDLHSAGAARARERPRGRPLLPEGAAAGLVEVHAPGHGPRGAGGRERAGVGRMTRDAGGTGRQRVVGYGLTGALFVFGWVVLGIMLLL